jgi:hypothetical protein
MPLVPIRQAAAGQEAAERDRVRMARGHQTNFARLS